MGNLTSGLLGGAIGFAVAGPVGFGIGMATGGLTGLGAEVAVGISSTNATYGGKYYIDTNLDSVLKWIVNTKVEIRGFELMPLSGIVTPVQMIFAPMATIHNGGPCNPVHHYAVFQLLSNLDEETKWILAELIPTVGNRSVGIHLTLFDTKKEIDSFYPNSFLIKTEHILVSDVSEFILKCKSFSPNYNLLNKNCQHFCVSLVDKLKKK
jgi:hypothetical protein